MAGKDMRITSQRKPGQPLGVKTMERVAELIGLGLSHSETAGAAGVSERTVARILAKPEYRRMAEDVRRQRGSASTQVRAIIGDLLSAEKHDGQPDMAARGKGVEYAAKLGLDVLDEMEALDGDEALLPGVVLRFPWSQPEISRISEEGGRAEAQSTPRANSENGTTLPPPDLDLDVDCSVFPAADTPADISAPEIPQPRSPGPEVEAAFTDTDTDPECSCANDPSICPEHEQPPTVADLFSDEDYE